MTSMTGIADKFFKALEEGKEWEGCNEYCTADATFSAQAEPLADMQHLHQYADWLKGRVSTRPTVSSSAGSRHTSLERPQRVSCGLLSAVGDLSGEARRVALNWHQELRARVPIP